MSTAATATATIYNSVGPTGTGAMWFGFSALVLTALYIFGKAFTICPSKRIFHYLSFSVCAVASLSYMTMALGLGKTIVNGREIFYGRYLDWMVSTPQILTALGLLAHLSATNIFALVVLDELMIVSGYIGLVVPGSGAWALFAFGCVCFVPLVYFLFEDFDFERSSKGSGQKSADSYKLLSCALAGLWCFYPILWGLTRTKAISTDGEVVFYMVLDVTAKAVFLSWLISTNPTVGDDDDEEEEEEEEKDEKAQEEGRGGSRQ